jgi:hypothetical protein
MENNPPATIPLWHFDEEKGIWVEEGIAIRQGNGYIGTVKHFSWVNLDLPAGHITIKGKITNCEDKPVGAKVTVKSYTTTHANSKGEYTIFVPENTPFTLSVKSADYFNYSPEQSYNIPGKSVGSIVTQDFILPCVEGGIEKPDEPGLFAIEKASIKYNLYQSTLGGGTIPDRYDDEDPKGSVILTFDKYGQRARIDNREGYVYIWDITTQTNYANGKWSPLNSSSLYVSASWLNGQKYYEPYRYTGIVMGNCYIDSYWIPVDEIVKIKTTTENIAGKTCTVDTYRFTREPEACYWRFGYWNGIPLLSEGTHVLRRDHQYTVLTSVAQKIVTDIPSNAFDPNVDVTTWMK